MSGEQKNDAYMSAEIGGLAERRKDQKSSDMPREVILRT